MEFSQVFLSRGPPNENGRELYILGAPSLNDYLGYPDHILPCKHPNPDYLEENEENIIEFLEFEGTPFT